MREKLLSLVLILSMIIGFCPVFAVEKAVPQQPSMSEQTEEQSAEQSRVSEQTQISSYDTASEQADTQVIYVGTATQRSGTAEDAGFLRLRAASAYQAVGDPNLDYVDQLSDNDTATESYQQLKTAFEQASYTLTSDGVAEIAYTPQTNIEFYSVGDKPTKEEQGQVMQGVFLGVSAFRYDHPEIFYLDPECRASYGYTLVRQDESGGCYWKIVSITLKITLLFPTSSALKTAQQKYNQAIDTALAEASRYSSRDEQVKALHDWLCNQIVYESAAEFAHSSYGALVTGECVCEGYAKALKVLCDQLNIPCKMVLGTGYTSSGSDAHMWNYVQMEDKQWYAVDVTWDDQYKIYDDYLLIGSESVSPQISKGTTFEETHVPTGYFTTDTTTMAFRYPELCKQAYVREIKLNHDKLTLSPGSSSTLTAQLLPESTVAREVIWSSNQESVVSVDQNGKITAHNTGTAVITATSGNGAAASCRVRVLELSTPELISAEDGKVQWNAVNGAQYYRVYRKTVDSNWKRIAVTQSTLYTDSAVPRDQVSIYTVRAYIVRNDDIILSDYDPVGVCYVPVVDGIQAVGNGWNCTVSWDKVAGASGYRVYRKTNGGQWKTIASQITSVSMTDQELQDGIQYTYTVRAYYTESGKTVLGGYDPAGASVIADVPIPSGLQAVSVGYDRIKVAWNAVSGASGYRIYRISPTDTKWRIVKTVDSSIRSITDTNVNSGVTYRYTVRAYRETVNGTEWTGYDSEGASVTANPPVPSGLQAVSVGYDRIKVTWDAVSGAGGYRIYRLSPTDTKWRIVKTVSSSTRSVTDSGLACGTRYRYTVRAYRNTASGTQWTGYDEMGVSATPTLETVPLVSAAAGNGSITVRWKPVSGAQGYRVYRKTAGGNWKAMKTVSSSTTSWKNSGLNSGTTYYYTVRAYRKVNGNTVWGGYQKNGVTATVK